ncbi:hypothetical protein [Streptomyces chartreusis]|uniref:hypothetical protein n=1 Tax=Streptomyces chartreusis TaxID=1969 RepID=UPI0037F7D4E8
MLIGDSGAGTAHLLIGVGTAIAADAARRPSSVIAHYNKVDLLCLDEFDYLNPGAFDV